MGGAVGLDYGPMFHKMDRMNLTKEEYEEMEADMQTMEQEALNIIKGSHV